MKNSTSNTSTCLWYLFLFALLTSFAFAKVRVTDGVNVTLTATQNVIVQPEQGIVSLRGDTNVEGDLHVQNQNLLSLIRDQADLIQRQALMIEQLNETLQRMQRISQNVVQASGYFVDETDSGLLQERSLTFQKLEDNTRLKLSYSDNFRAYSESHGAGCRWRVLLDGQFTTPPLSIFVWASPQISTHYRSTVEGVLTGIPSGLHNVTITLDPVNPEWVGDCMTGNVDVWFIAAEEFI